MPLYDIECLSCGIIEAIVPWSEDPALDCPECGDAAMRLPTACITVGPMPSKPLFSNADGEVIDSNEKLRDFLRRSPGTEVVSPDSRDWKDHYDRVRNKAEKRAQGRGYRDFHHQKTHWRDRKRRRAEEQKRTDA